MLFLLCSAVLFVTDIRQHRLPNIWTATLALGCATLLGGSTLTASDNSVLSDRLATMLISGVSYGAVMLLIHVITRGAMGMGDVKLAVGLGFYTGFLGFEPLILSFFLAFLFGGLQALYLVVVKGAHKSTRLAFGPAMLLGCLTVLIL